MTLPSDSNGRLGQRPERLDALFTALADEHRRQVVRYFISSQDHVASVADLIDDAVENGSGESSRDQLELVYYHATLPKLAALGVIEYNARSRTVRYRGSQELKRLLTVVAESHRRTE